MIRSILTPNGQLYARRSALIALFSVAGLSIASSLVGLLFQLTLAARFGASGSIDGYLFSISAATFLAALGAAALSYTITPALVQVDKDICARVGMLRHLRRRVGGVALVFALLGVPAMILQPLLLPSSSHLSSFDGLRTMIALGWMTGGVQLFTALFSIELNASRRPVWAAMLALPPNLGAIAVVLAGPRSILTPAVGVLTGSIVAASLGIALTWRAFHAARGNSAFPSTRGSNVQDLGWTLVAMSCFSAYAVIDAFWAPRAAEGVLASLGFAQRLIIGIGALIVAGPSAVLTPRFASRLRDHGPAEFLNDVRRAVLLVGLCSVALSIPLALFADQLVALAFGRGRFAADDVVRVATVLRAMSPGFAAMLMSVVMTRAIYCLPSVARQMAFIGLGWSATYFVGCGLLFKTGGWGFGISFSLAWSLYMILAAVTLAKRAR